VLGEGSWAGAGAVAIIAVLGGVMGSGGGGWAVAGSIVVLGGVWSCVFQRGASCRVPVAGKAREGMERDRMKGGSQKGTRRQRGERRDERRDERGERRGEKWDDVVRRKEEKG